MVNLAFPFRYAPIPHIGRILQPVIPIHLQTVRGLVEFQFLVDTGSDLTMLPYFMARQLRLDLSRSHKIVAEGIGGFRLTTWLVTIDLHFPKTTVKVRASITNENSTPFLLGRVDLLDVLYSWNFDAVRKEIQFVPVSSSKGPSLSGPSFSGDREGISPSARCRS